MADELDRFHKKVLVTGFNHDGTPFSGYMVEAEFAPTRRVHGKHRPCARCGIVLPVAEMRRVGSAYLCFKYGCAEEGPLRSNLA